jgi:uncharacterized protein (DUF2267 family)
MRSLKDLSFDKVKQMDRADFKALPRDIRSELNERLLSNLYSDAKQLFFIVFSSASTFSHNKCKQSQ